MISLQIKDVKPFMNKLLLSDYCDAFLVSEATFVTFSTFHIDGALKKDYYSEEELEEQHMQEQTHAAWRQIRPFCLELIKGKHTPLEFKIVFRLSPSNTEKLLHQADISLTSKDISGLFLNIHFLYILLYLYIIYIHFLLDNILNNIYHILYYFLPHSFLSFQMYL